MKIVAIIPMRHSSERVKGKNYKVFSGRPLFHYIIETLLSCTSITQVCIDTDSPIIINDVTIVFPKVKVILRPENLRDGATSMNLVLENSIAQIDADLYMQTHSTNPLLRSETIEKAISLFTSDKEHDSLFGVTRLQTRLYDEQGKPINHNPNVLLRTQDLPPIYEENSNLYLFTKESFLETRNRIGNNPMLFEIPREEAWDIDKEIDFQVAELLYKERESL